MLINSYAVIVYGNITNSNQVVKSIKSVVLFFKLTIFTGFYLHSQHYIDTCTGRVITSADAAWRMLDMPQRTADKRSRIPRRPFAAILTKFQNVLLTYV